MLNIIKDLYKNYFNFKGRSTRKEFFVCKLYVILVLAIIGVAFYYSTENLAFNYESLIDNKAILSYGLPMIITVTCWLLFCITALIPNISITIRRLHDAGMSSWMYWVNYAIMISDYYVWKNYNNMKVVNIITLISLVFTLLLFISVLLPSDNYNKWGLDPRSYKKKKVKMSHKEKRERKKIHKENIKEDKKVKKNAKKIKKQIKKDEKAAKKSANKKTKETKKETKSKNVKDKETKNKINSKNKSKDKTKNDNQK